MALSFNLRVGESLDIGAGIATVTLMHKSGQRATLKVETDRAVAVTKVENPIAPIAALRGVIGK